MTVDLGNMLDRFHRTLVEEIRRNKPEYLRRPFMIAEIYQTLVPYRSHRDVLGVEINGDYEDALLRLLAGERGYLLVESDTAREQMAAELESRNPNVGLYRDFAAVEVRLNPAFVVDERAVREPEENGMAEDETAPSGGAGDPQEELALEEGADEGPASGPSALAEPATPTRPAAGPSRAEPTPPAVAGRPSPVARPANAVQAPGGAPLVPPEPAVLAPAGPGASPAAGREIRPVAAPSPEAVPESGPSTRATPGGPPAGPASVATVTAPGQGAPSPAAAGRRVGESAAGACGRCAEPLPVRPDLRFCPFCGSPQTAAECGSCGAALEPGWGFCIRCGRHRTA